MSRILALAVLAAAAAPVLGGCAGLAVGAAVTGGAALVEERSLGNQVDDLTVKLAINEALFAHDERLFRDVSIDVTEGRVLLTGKVPTATDRVDAVRLAWQAEGVVEVINELQVAESGDLVDYFDDLRISNELRFHLFFDREITAINFNVDTVDGVVYITGIASDRAELDRVLDHARHISGVKEVVSHVRIESG